LNRVQLGRKCQITSCAQNAI